MALDTDSRQITLDETEKQYVEKIQTICEDSRAPREMKKNCDHLYLGNVENARQIVALKENSVTYIINTVHEENGFMKTGIQFYGEEFKYLGFYSEDNGTYPILRHFDEVFKFIEKARENHSKCLIHCMAGINRSGCLATAYYMVYKGVGPISAVKHVHGARGMLLSNKTFIERLVKFASGRNLLEVDKDEL